MYIFYSLDSSPDLHRLWKSRVAVHFLSWWGWLSSDDDDCVYGIVEFIQAFFHGHCNMHNKALLTRDNTRTHRETSVEWNIFIEPLQKNGSTRPSQSQVIFKGLNESEFSFLWIIVKKSTFMFVLHYNILLCSTWTWTGEVSRRKGEKNDKKPN